MGTRWKGLLAPLGTSTGDGRRFLAAGITHRELPFALKWQRNDEGGHDASVVVGSCDGIEITETGVWGTGELFDDVDASLMPRLAEDVAEAKLLTERKVIGPSVDAGAASAVMVEIGSDEPVSDERAEELWEEAWESGEDPKLEILFTEYEIAAATLVTVPAFAECAPFELETPDEEEPPADGEPADTAAVQPSDAGMVVALVAAAGPVAPESWFADPALPEVTPLTITDDGRIYGHVAAFGTCHAGIRDLCVTPPTSAHAYAHFNRYTTTGTGQALPVPAGRITAAHGSLTGACSCCPGIDDHACNKLSMGATIAHYDRARTLAYVVAGEDEHGIWVAGLVNPDADERDRRLLARQKVSGDWRDVAGSLELVEVLALAREKPGFPLPHTTMSAGRQLSLVAAGAVSAARTGARPTRVRGALLDYDRLGRTVARELVGMLPAGTTLAAGSALLPDAAAVQPPTDSTAVPAQDSAAVQPGTGEGTALKDQADQLAAEIVAAEAGLLLKELEDITHV